MRNLGNWVFLLFVSFVVVGISNGAFAQDRTSYRLSSSENPPIQCGQIAPSAANAQIQGLYAQIKGKGMVYACNYKMVKLQVLLASMGSKKSADTQNMTIKCSYSNPAGAYAFRASVGFHPSSHENILRFENATAGTSCVIVSAKTVLQLVSLQSASNPILPQLIMVLATPE